ncbi:phage protein [Streptococcus pneumoniae]|nr:phage protein [Streptococcus pneumoniae]
MKVQRLIEKYKELYENVFDFRAKLACQLILQDLEQLDEPSKVKVPQFVADWIENSKQEKRNLRNALNNGSEKMRLWLLDQENYDLFARAWLDGYEVEKEKRYLVKMKGIDTNFNFLNRYRNENYWIFSSKDKNTLYQTHHTRKELEEADFGWVFDCPGIEIEEVE